MLAFLFIECDCLLCGMGVIVLCISYNYANRILDIKSFSNILIFIEKLVCIRYSVLNWANVLKSWCYKRTNFFQKLSEVVLDVERSGVVSTTSLSNWSNQDDSALFTNTNFAGSFYRIMLN